MSATILDRATLVRVLSVASVTPAVLATVAEAQTERRIHPRPPVLEQTIGEAEVELYRPLWLAASDSGLILVFDASDMNVRAFNADGREVWQAGRKGGGPGEFAGATDLKTDASGNTWVLDNSNRRITQVSPRGAIEQMISLPQNIAARRLLPLAGLSTSIVPAGTDLMAMEISSPGVAGRAIRYPEKVTFSASIAGEPYTVRIGDARWWCSVGRARL